MMPDRASTHSSAGKTDVIMLRVRPLRTTRAMVRMTEITAQEADTVIARQDRESRPSASIDNARATANPRLLSLSDI